MKLNNNNFKNKYEKYKKKYLKLKEKINQYAGNTIDDDIATYTMLSTEQSISEEQRMQYTIVLNTLQTIKDNNDISFLRDICKNEDNISITLHCKNKISRLLQENIVVSDYTLDQTIDILTKLQFKTDEVNIVLAKLLKIRETDFTIQENIQELVNRMDHENNAIIKKYIEKIVGKIFESQNYQSKEGASKKDASKEGESKEDASREGDVPISFSSIDENIDALVPLLLKVNDKINSCFNVSFEDQELAGQRKLMAARATSAPIVAPYRYDRSKYMNDHDHDLMDDRGYHRHGYKGDPVLLEFYFRHFLFSSAIYFALPITKGSSPKSVATYFINDEMFSKFFNYILNSTQFGITIKELGMIYQQLKILEEHRHKHYRKLSRNSVLSLLNSIIIGSIFLICDSLAKKGKLRIPIIDGNDVDIDSEYTQTVNLSDGLDECRDLFTNGLDDIKRIKAYLHATYNFQKTNVNKLIKSPFE